MFFMPMVANIPSDDRGRHGIPHCPNKIPILPKLAFPQLLPQFRKLFEHPARRNTLQDPYDLGNRIAGRKIQKDMDMVLRHFQFFNLKSKVLGNWPEQLLHPSPDIFPINPLPVFGSPHHMVFRVIHRMAGAFKGHPSMVSQPGPASGRLNVSSPPKGRGFHVRFSEIKVINEFLNSCWVKKKKRRIVPKIKRNGHFNCPQVS